MPRCCSVIGCRSNYRSEKETVSTFSLPKEPLRSIWLRKIPTDFTGLKNPIICIKHFDESVIIRTDKCIVKGQVKEFPRKIPKLKEGAVPTIFKNVPKYLTKTPTSVNRLADVEKSHFETAVKASLQEYEEYQQQRSISTLQDILQYFKVSKQKLKEEWTLLNNEQKIVFCYIDISGDSPYILGSIVVQCNLSFEIYINNCKTAHRRIPKNISVINSYSTLEELIAFVESKITVRDTAQSKLDIAIDLLDSINVDTTDAQISFISEQLKLSGVSKNNRRYSGNTHIFAASMYIHSSVCYNALYNSNCLYLPHQRNLQKMISSFSLGNNTIQGSIEYLKTKMQFLKDHELLVNLLLDEIYTEPQLNFKGGNIFGCSENDPSKVAKTAQVFMISSIVSKYKDVVSIIPVHNLTAEHLKYMISSVLVELEKIGFKIISLISDNNAINRKAFELFTPNKILQPEIVHPLDKSRKLFFIFDPVHIIKCVRNNWITKRSETGCIKFPDMDSGMVLKAQYKHLEIMYELEKNSLIKYGHLLSNKVLYPSSIQKQIVKLALRIFNDNNISALKCVAKNNSTILPGYEETCCFLQIFCTWWKIVNVHSAFEGQRFNDEYREPIRSENKLQLDFLQKMALWLKNWKQTLPVCETLTSQTFQSLICTNEAFVKLIPYMFNNYKLDYLLLGKFQTDDLEGRFGCYRQLSGANYYISYMQVLESERKLRFKSVVVLSSKDVEIPLKTVLPCQETYINTIDIGCFYSVLEYEFSLNNIPENILPILTYIAGFTVRKELRLKKCRLCVSWLQAEKMVDVEAPFQLIKELDRGKLILPTELATVAAASSWFTLQKLIDMFRDKFLSTQHQLSVLHRISIIQLCQHLDKATFDINEQCVCESTLKSKLENINLRACKIMLNNLVKKENDVRRAQTSSHKKLKKFNTT